MIRRLLKRAKIRAMIAGLDLSLAVQAWRFDRQLRQLEISASPFTNRQWGIAIKRYEKWGQVETGIPWCDLTNAQRLHWVRLAAVPK